MRYFQSLLVHRREAHWDLSTPQDSFQTAELIPDLSWPIFHILSEEHIPPSPDQTITNYPKMYRLQQQTLNSQFLWVRNPRVAWPGTSGSGFLQTADKMLARAPSPRGRLGGRIRIHAHSRGRGPGSHRGLSLELLRSRPLTTESEKETWVPNRRAWASLHLKWVADNWWELLKFFQSHFGDSSLMSNCWGEQKFNYLGWNHSMLSKIQ